MAREQLVMDKGNTAYISLYTQTGHTQGNSKRSRRETTYMIKTVYMVAFVHDEKKPGVSYYAVAWPHEGTANGFPHITVRGDQYHEYTDALAEVRRLSQVAP